MERHQEEIIYDSLCQVNDANEYLSQIVSIAIVQAIHPNSYQIFLGHNNIPLRFDRLLWSAVSQVLRDRCIKTLELLKESNVPANITLTDLLQQIDMHSKQVPLNMVAVSSLKSNIKSCVLRINNLVKRYQEIMDNYSKEYLIPIKLKRDYMQVNVLSAKSQDICYSNRLKNLRKVYEKSGSVTDIDKSKDEKRSLDVKSDNLSSKIAESETRLNLYRSCDNHLISEYLKVKEQLDEQKWAKSYFGNNLSNLSLSD